MTGQELHAYLQSAFPKENEECEWKEFKDLKHCVSGREGDDIISYTSGIANMNGGHLIIGIEDGSLNIIGISNFHHYTIDNIKLKLLQDCLNLSSENLKIAEITTTDTNKTVWIIHIPQHPFRLPVYAHKKAWQRVNDSLVAMTGPRLFAILHETQILEDWSIGIILEASIDDLDPQAIAKARFEYRKRSPKHENELDTWDDQKFLDKAKITIRAKVTRTALILLGKEESLHYINPSLAQIRWNLKTIDNQDKDYEIFSGPFILAVDEVLGRIRNLKYRYLRPGTLFPDEVLRFDPFVIRELLHNCIAHQDYTAMAMINIVEFEDDHLVFSNYGDFIPASIEEVVLKDVPEEHYRNPFLVEAMRNLGMIETQGGGIRKIFNKQKERFFPMPDYDLKGGKVKVTLQGKILDEKFLSILSENPTISMEEVILLDKVQKKIPLSDFELKHLRTKKFIEGRKPNVYLSSSIAVATDNSDLKASYIHQRSFDDDHFKAKIVSYIRRFGKARREHIEKLIMPKLSDALNEKQKKSKIGNLLTALRKANEIHVNAAGEWKLVE